MTDNAEILRFIRDYHKQLYANKMDNHKDEENGEGDKRTIKRCQQECMKMDGGMVMDLARLNKLKSKRLQGKKAR